MDRTRAAVVSLRQLVRPGAGDVHVELRSVPARPVAAVDGHVEHDQAVVWFDVTYGRLGAWVIANALAVDGPIYETYRVGPRDTADSRRWRTEIGWPVFRLAAAVEPAGRRGTAPSSRA